MQLREFLWYGYGFVRFDYFEVLGFDDSGTALMLSIFALQDSFGTACNITGDGAIALMVTEFFKGGSGKGEN